MIVKDWHLSARELYRSGMSTYQIGRKLGRNPANVYRALVKLGVTTRSEDRIAVPHREKAAR